ncbi:Origin recognition complex subunit 2 [Tulasnella sp. 330]|nr:Origin recognition complex subunit 2 [Tulasnella sp. 330]KAG8886612.1 Origin recognition complex subunit 2 [Tulasnella sp. 331]
MSDGFRQALKSRQTIPETLLSASDRDDDPDDEDDPETSFNESPSKRRSTFRRTASKSGLAASSSQGSPLKRSFSSLTLGSSANGKNGSGSGRARTRRSSQGDGGDLEAVTATPTKPKHKQNQGILFVTGDARPKTTPRKAAGRKNGAGTPSTRANGATSEGKSRNKEKDRQENEEMETPSRQRTRRDVPNGSSVKGRRKPEHKRERSVEIEVDENRDEDYAQASGSRSRTVPKPKKKIVALRFEEDEEEESEDDLPQGPQAEEEEDEGIEEGATDDESRSTASSEDPIASLTKRTPSKQKAKAAANQSALEVPGFITQTSFDVYFQQISISARTSGRTFTSELPTLSSQAYWDHLAASASTADTKHEAELLRLRQTHVKFFPRYMMELQAGFNLLFYGFGSKRETLNQFARQFCAKKGDVVVLNGYRPGIGVKELLNQIDGLRGDTAVSSNGVTPSTSSLSATEVQAQRIHNHYFPSQSPNNPTTPCPLFIVIHNIDSTGLRNQKSKAILALLASNPRIHLIGSVDHMNAPLIWKQSEASGRGHEAPSSQVGATEASDHATATSNEKRVFTWLWHDLTTFEHYDVELRASGKDLTSLTVSGSGKPKLSAVVGGAAGGPAAAAGPLTESGAHQVLSSVTERSRKIFILLANRQLADIDAEVVVAESPSKKANVTGAQMHCHALSYESLFSLARECFIATSDQALRGLLQEFKDHGMVVMGASNTGGGEMIWIPLARNILEKLIDSIGEH